MVGKVEKVETGIGSLALNNLMRDAQAAQKKFPVALNVDREAISGLPGFDTKIYDDMLEKADSSAKLNFALALMQAGFGAAGASAKQGESKISTLSRTLLAPLSQAAGQVVGASNKEKMAARLGKLQAEGRISSTAYSAALADKTAEEAFRNKLILQNLKPKTAVAPSVRGGPDKLQFNIGTKKEPNYIFVETNVVRPKTEGGKPFFELASDVADPTDPTKVLFQSGAKISAGTGYGQYTKPDDSKTGTSAKPVNMPGTYRMIVEPKKVEGQKPLWAVNDEIQVIRQLDSKGVWRLVAPALDNLVITPRIAKIVSKASGTAGSSKGIDDPVAQASFEGMIGQWPKFATVNSDLNGGLVITEANKAKLLRNPTLKAGDDFAITRRDGKEISEADQKNLNTRFRNMHLSAGKNLKKGVDFLDINRKVLSNILSMSTSDLGLPQSPGQRVEQKFATNPGRISTIYEATARKLKTLTPEGSAIPAIETLNDTPMPISTNNMRTGIGKLKIASVMSQRPFRNTGLVKRVKSSNLNPTQLAAAEPYLLGGGQMKGIDPEDVQDRVLLEVMSADPSMNSVINPAVTPDTASQTAAMAGEFKKVKQAQRAKWDHPDAQTARKQVGLLTNTLELIDDISALAHASKTPGFGQGAVEKAFFAVSGMNPMKFFKSEKGKAAADRLIAIQPQLKQLLTRDLVVLKEGQAGKVSDRDVAGMQTVIPKLDQSEKYNAALLKELRGFVVKALNQQLQGIGYYKPGKGDMQRLAALGIDTKKLPNNNNYYHPLIGGKFRVSKTLFPEYSDELIENLKNRGAVRPLKNPLRDTYSLIRTDANGAPVYKYRGVGTNRRIIGYERTTLTLGDLKKPKYRKLLNFNAEKLRLK